MSSYKRSKVLITGGLGFTGSNLARALVGHVDDSDVERVMLAVNSFDTA